MAKNGIFPMMLVMPWHVLVACFIAHPVHVSVCEIAYNFRTERLELVQRIFLRDLEETLQHNGQDPYLDIMHPRDSIAFDSLLQAYCSARIQLWTDKKKYALRYLGHERLGHEMCIYMEGERNLRLPPDTIRIRNVLLFEQFRTQKNRINLRIGEKAKSVLLHQGKEAQDIVI